MKKKKPEISIQMEHRICQVALGKLVSSGVITYSEAMVYNILRSHAFKKKGVKKRISKTTHQAVAEILELHPNVVHKKVRVLEKAGLLIPIFKINFMGQQFDAENFEQIKKDYGLRAITHKNYIIVKSKEEISLEKQYLKAHRLSIKSNV